MYSEAFTGSGFSTNFLTARTSPETTSPGLDIAVFGSRTFGLGHQTFTMRPDSAATKTLAAGGEKKQPVSRTTLIGGKRQARSHPHPASGQRPHPPQSRGPNPVRIGSSRTSASSPIAPSCFLYHEAVRRIGDNDRTLKTASYPTPVKIVSWNVETRSEQRTGTVLGANLAGRAGHSSRFRHRRT